MRLIIRAPHQRPSIVNRDFPVLFEARRGTRPQTCRELPHLQLDQWPNPEIIEQLHVLARNIPEVYERESRMATPGTHALCIPDEIAKGPASAFIDDHEFCHLHPSPRGSIHTTLPLAARTALIEFGWGEKHPGAVGGYLPETLVMVYAPRDEEEVRTVLNVISTSLAFAQGRIE